MPVTQPGRDRSKPRPGLSQKQPPTVRVKRAIFIIRSLAACALLVGFALAPAISATRTQPATNHTWQLTTIEGAKTAVAFTCPDCPPALTLRCPHRHRGLLELSIPAASVANGRHRASKQIRLTVGSKTLRRRATTIKTAAGYTPVIDLATDDPLVNELTSGGLLKLNFYGQRAVVGLKRAGIPIGQVISSCRPLSPHTIDSSPAIAPNRHCIWLIVTACAGHPDTLRQSVPRVKGATVRRISDRHCLTWAETDLSAAKAKAARLGGHLQRSCLR